MLAPDEAVGKARDGNQAALQLVVALAYWCLDEGANEDWELGQPRSQSAAIASTSARQSDDPRPRQPHSRQAPLPRSRRARRRQCAGSPAGPR